MTLHARLVLSDTREAARGLPQDSDLRLFSGSEMRRNFLTVITLLRSVGNVLNEVDGKNGSEHLRRAINEKWQESKPPIWDFIDSYRSAVVKRYEHPDVEFDMDMGTEYPRLVERETKTSVAWLVDQALLFWEDYLNDVDSRAKRYEQLGGN